MKAEVRARLVSIGSLLAGLLLIHAAAAGATTEESVIGGGEGEDRIEYNINAPSIGDPPEYWPIAIRFSFPALPGPGPFLITYSDEIISVVPPSAGTYVFELVVTDSTGRPVHQLGAPATFEFVYDALSVPSTSNACLSYFNEGTNEWECQDTTLSCDGNTLCGDTDHLTTFGIGPVPEPSTALLLGLGGALLGALRRLRLA
jgi:hypothetical protein